MNAKKTITLVGSLLMLVVALLLPLVNLMSYHFTLFELPHKIQRLVDGTGAQIIGYVLLVGLVLCPLVLGVYTWMKGCVSKTMAVLPLCFSAILTILLLVAKKPNPGVGLWIYLGLAVVVAIVALRRKKI